VMDASLALPRADGEPLTLVLEGADDALEMAFGHRCYWSGRIEYADVSEEPGVRDEGPFRPTAARYIVTPATRPAGDAP